MIKKTRNGFTLLELVFVIVIMGILAKFGVGFIAEAYRNFIFSSINNKLQAKSEYAVETIAKRLQGRIKPSVIYRDMNYGNSDVNFRSLQTGTDVNASVLEWIGYDTDGYRTGYWDGVLDLNKSDLNRVVTIKSDTSNEDRMIKSLSDDNSTFDDAAIFFVGEAMPVTNNWGWDGNVSLFDVQANVDIHPVRKSTSASEKNMYYPIKGSGADNNFSNVEAKEYYKLAWSAYAVSLEDYNTTTKMGNLYLYYNYQPWKGEQYDESGKGIRKVLIQDSVSSFQFRAVGSLIKIQVCSKDNLIADEEYSICKEKTVY